MKNLLILKKAIGYLISVLAVLFILVTISGACYEIEGSIFNEYKMQILEYWLILFFLGILLCFLNIFIEETISETETERK